MSAPENPTPEEKKALSAKGMIAWMARNGITANLVMIFLIGGGLWTMTTIKQEVFPEFTLDRINVSVAYPGASPAETEQGVVLPVEQALQGLDGVKEITANAGEGSGSVSLELFEDADHDEVLSQVEQAVGRIRTFPDEAERPEVEYVARRREVLDLLIYGDVGERALRVAAEQVRDRLLADPRITQVDLEAARGYEIHVEVDQNELRRLGLSLDDIAQRIRQSSVERPGGKLETRSGELLVRVTDRRDWANEFAEIPLLNTEGGGVVKLGQVAEVTEGFADSFRSERYDGKPAMTLEVYRVGEETPIGVSDAVRELMAGMETLLPTGVDYQINNDRSEYYEQRLTLLVKNIGLGLLLVLIVLGLFLELRVAFWVTMGIPVSFLGAVLFLPAVDVSINIISLFAFIVSLGIVVDDAIVAGENIFEAQERGLRGLAGAIEGARRVAVPITFSILSNVVAFLPLFFVPGTLGKIWQVIPAVTIAVFLISWVESLLILPSHLAHGEVNKDKKKGGSLIAVVQGAISGGLKTFIDRVYAPFVKLTIRYRFFTMAVGFAFMATTLGYVFGGHIGMVLMPRVESDYASATVNLPPGSPRAQILEVAERLESSIMKIGEENGGDELMVGTLTRIRETRIDVRAYLTPPEERPMSTSDVSKAWREEVGTITGVRGVRFSSEGGGPGGGAALTIELSHQNADTLDRAKAALEAELGNFPNVKDVYAGFNLGKRQIDVKLNDTGAALGLTSAAVSRQIRSAYFGAEALRQLRMSDEVKVLVRRPESERDGPDDIEALLIETPAGTRVPLGDIASVSFGRAFRSIERRNAKRTATVTADVQPIGETQQVMATLNENVFPKLAADYPGLVTTYQGRQSSMRESTDALFKGLLIAFLMIYFLLAIPFRSYIQPLIVMIAIPFGVIGAVMGHVIMDYNLSLISLMGIVALSGIVVNDSLVLVEYANQRRREGATPIEAIRDAASRRFRPVLLTTMTTFGGLAPMIFETSRQARFMIPMALSLGFGILFATFIILLLVPALYVLAWELESVLASLGRLRRRGPNALGIGGQN